MRRCLVLALVCGLGTMAWADDGNHPRQQTLERLVEKYNRHVRRGQADKADAVAHRLNSKFPGHPIAELVQRHQRLVTQHDTNAVQSKSATRPLRETRTYPVADLVVPVPSRVRMDVTESATNPKPAAADFTSLAELITSTIDPESWEQAGGGGKIRAYESTLSLVITHTAAVHEEVADLLEQLRRQQDVQISVGVKFIELPEDFFERIGVDFVFEAKATDSDETATGTAILADEQATVFINAVQNNERANLMFAPKITLFNGQSGEILTGPKTEPWAQHISVSAAVSPDRRTVRVRFTNHKKPDAGITTIAVPDGQSALIDVGSFTLEGRHERGVPILEKLPYTSRLFKSTGIARETVRRYVLLTPRGIVEEEEELLSVPNH